MARKLGKLLVFSLLLLLVYGILFLLQNSKVVTSIAVSKQNLVHTVIKGGLSPNKLESRSAEKNQTTSTISTEVSSAIYSEDWYVEAFSIKAVASKCRYINSDWLRDALNQRQRVTFDGALKTCNELMQQLPLLSQKDSMIDDLPASSLAGQMLKNWPMSLRSNEEVIKRAQHAMAFLPVALKAKNPHLIDKAIGNLVFWPDEFFHDLLGGWDDNYHRQVFELAMKALSCEVAEGIYCSDQSWLMLEKCEQNTRHCGMSYQHWMDKELLPGTLKDVNKITAHFRPLLHSTD